jgi:hypothetical protein
MARFADSDAVQFCSPDGTRCVQLIDSEPGGFRFQQGYPVPFTLDWMSGDGPISDVEIRLTAVHDRWLPWKQRSPIITATLASPWAYTGEAPFCPSEQSIGARASTAVPQTGSFRVALPLVLGIGRGCQAPMPGRLVTVPGLLMIPPDAPTGKAEVMLEVLGPDGTRWETSGGEASVSLFALDIEGRPTLRKLPGDLTPVNVEFGNELSLRGYRVSGQARPGGSLQITYGWYARQRPTAIYSVFNHLTSPDGTIIAQVDGWPLEGRLLTIQWQRGEYVSDTHTLSIPDDAPPGPYTLYVGLYNAANRERPQVVQDGDIVPGGRVVIPLLGAPKP